MVTNMRSQDQQHPHCSLEPKFWGSAYTNFNKTLGVGHIKRSFVQPSEQQCGVGNMENHYSKWKIILAGGVLLGLWVQSTPSELGKFEASFWKPALWQSHCCHLSYLKQIIKSAMSLYKYTQKNIYFFPPWFFTFTTKSINNFVLETHFDHRNIVPKPKKTGQEPKEITN